MDETGSTEPPAPGWWQAADGGWHPPPTPSDLPVRFGQHGGLPPGGPRHGSTGPGRSPLLVVGAVIAAAAIAAIVVSRLGGGGRTITGQFVLADHDGYSGSTGSCSGNGGYSDFGPGMNVVVRDGDGVTIGATDTRAVTDEYLESVVDEINGDSDEDDGEPLTVEGYRDLMDLFGCTVTFEVDVPDVPFYEIEVGRRGTLTFSAAELDRQGNEVSLTLGG